ncbi:hypothetical protein G6F40_017332 [Rhizopus arrhizus]|nr:hypothetical protein G6F40_017332 [Rhizopus arrhizus]
MAYRFLFGSARCHDAKTLLAPPIGALTPTMYELMRRPSHVKRPLVKPWPMAEPPACWRPPISEKSWPANTPSSERP